MLADLARRGVNVRGLVWRSHADKAHFSEEENLHLVETVNEAGGEVLLDERVRRDGSHHQKLFVARHPDATDLDVAFVGGIDLCHGRRDDEHHAGDEQAIDLDPRYGPRPPWHDVQLEVRGPAVGDLAWTFRERWEDPTPLDHRNPWRRRLARRRPGTPTAAADAADAGRPRAGRGPGGADAADLPGQATAASVRAGRGAQHRPRLPQGLRAGATPRVRRGSVPVVRCGSELPGRPAARPTGPAPRRRRPPLPRPRRPPLRPALPDRSAAGHRAAPPGRRRPGDVLRPRGGVRLADLRPRQGRHRGRRLDDRGQRQPQHPLVDERLGAVLRRHRRAPRSAGAGRPWRPRRRCPQAGPGRRASRCGASTSDAIRTTTPTSWTPSRRSRCCGRRRPTSTPGTTAVAPAPGRPAASVTTGRARSVGGRSGGRTRCTGCSSTLTAGPGRYGAPAPSEMSAKVTSFAGRRRS